MTEYSYTWERLVICIY